MKNFKNISILIASGLVLVSSMLSSCKKDFFDLEDPTGIDSRIWNDEGAVGLFLNRTYSLVMPLWPVLGTTHTSSDEMNNANTAFLYGTLNENSVTDIGTSAGNNGNRYYDIRRCNLGIVSLDTSTINPITVKLYKGQFYFLRAMAYWKLVSVYGGVPLILEPTSGDDPDLNVPRAKTSECIASIVKDLDSAKALLPATWSNAESGRATRGGAMALKGRVLLYWASPQFNPSNQASRWTEAYNANKAAYTQLIADGFGLVQKYSDIFLLEDNANKEAIIIRKYNQSRDLGHNTENASRPFSESTAGGGSYQPTWNQVQAYGMNNGLPITNASSGYNNVMFWQNRDPRFDASIAFNGSIWPLSGKASRKQWSYVGVLDETRSTTGFWLKRFINPTLTAAQAPYNSNSGGGNGMDWIELRFAEVLLNLAECANETGNLVEAKDMVRLVRQRAGIVAGSQDYGLAIATDIASMRTLILNERQVEFALENKRYWDLRRTRNLNLISARQEFRWTPKPPYYAGITRTGAQPGDIFLDKPDAFGIKPRDTASILTNQSVYTAMFTTSVQSIEGSNVISIPSNYYFYALPTFFSQFYLIQQTKDWPNGTFDPLQ